MKAEFVDGYKFVVDVPRRFFRIAFDQTVPNMVVDECSPDKVKIDGAERMEVASVIVDFHNAEVLARAILENLKSIGE